MRLSWRSVVVLLRVGYGFADVRSVNCIAASRARTLEMKADRDPT